MRSALLILLAFSVVSVQQAEAETVTAQSEQVFYLMEPAAFKIGPGERAYLLEPEAVLQAIRKAEGVPSYGVMFLARKYGGHHAVPESVGRQAGARVVHKSYVRWRAAGRPGDFLDYLHRVYAPIGAANDPTGMNRYWHRNLMRHLGDI